MGQSSANKMRIILTLVKIVRTDYFFTVKKIKVLSDLRFFCFEEINKVDFD
ncbi:hypothetical protein D3C71_206760 [compost metagenome]